MGLRFRKIFSVLPGVRLNVSKSGVSTSLGGHGATVNVGTNGKRTVTLGIPGTGLSYATPLNALTALLVVAAILIVGIVYLVAPEVVLSVLHAWQPKWF